MYLKRRNKNSLPQYALLKNKRSRSMNTNGDQSKDAVRQYLSLTTRLLEKEKKKK
jgi:hypothetical protein